MKSSSREKSTMIKIGFVIYSQEEVTIGVNIFVVLTLYIFLKPLNITYIIKEKTKIMLTVAISDAVYSFVIFLKGLSYIA